jgi:hypothetical protein
MYTLVTKSLLLIINLTLPLIILLKNSQQVNPTNTNDAKYGSLFLNTTPKTKVYISIKQRGSIIHHNQFKYESATSLFNSAFAE